MRTSSLLIGSVAVHAVAYAVALWAPRPAPKRESRIAVEIAAPRTRPAPPLLPQPPASPPVAALPRSPVANAPTLARGRAVQAAAPASMASDAVPAAAVRLPVDEVEIPSAGGAVGELGPMVPPGAPPPPAAVARAERKARELGADWERLSTLLRSWRHQPEVYACLEDQVKAAGVSRRGSAKAQTEMLAALNRGDWPSAEAWARRVEGGAADFARIYLRARGCIH